MLMVGHAAQWKKILLTVSTICTSPGAVWTCIIKERNTRKYEYVIHLATIASSWNDIDIESKPKSKFPYYSTVCSKNHKTHISLNSSPIFNVKIALELC